jgi:hypothetical protein
LTIDDWRQTFLATKNRKISAINNSESLTIAFNRQSSIACLARSVYWHRSGCVGPDLCLQRIQQYPDGAQSGVVFYQRAGGIERDQQAGGHPPRALGRLGTQVRWDSEHHGSGQWPLCPISVSALQRPRPFGISRNLAHREPECASRCDGIATGELTRSVFGPDREAVVSMSG